MTFGLSDNVNVNSVTTGDVSLSTNGINAGGQKVTNVKMEKFLPILLMQ